MGRHRLRRQRALVSLALCSAALATRLSAHPQRPPAFVTSLRYLPRSTTTKVTPLGVGKPLCQSRVQSSRVQRAAVDAGAVTSGPLDAIYAGGVANAASTLAKASFIITPLAAFFTSHPVATVTFAAIIGWASIDGPNMYSRALFQEALKLVGATIFLTVVPGALYGEIAQPGYVLLQLST